jgi:hypothetical protein
MLNAADLLNLSARRIFFWLMLPRTNSTSGRPRSSLANESDLAHGAPPGLEELDPKDARGSMLEGLERTTHWSAQSARSNTSNTA